MPRGTRLAARHVARFATAQGRLVGQQIGIGADDGQRRPQFVGDQRDQLAARLVDGLEGLDPCLGLGLLAALLDDPGQQVGHGTQLGDVVIAERARLLGLDVEHPDRLVVPGERHRQHRRHEAALVDPAHPQEAVVGLDVGNDQRSPVRRDAAGHALAERDARPADLEAVEPVRRGEGQVRSIAVEQVQRGDVGVEHIAGPVDDGLEQLVPGSGGRRQAGDLVQEAQLLELVDGTVRARRGRAGILRAGGRGRGSDGRHGRHDTSLRNGCGPEGCDRVATRTRNGRVRCPA